MTSRGERNNNPFNLVKTGTLWRGEIKPGKDERFCQFSSMLDGIRAGLLTLWNGYFTKGLTLRQIINKYAPSHENDTDSYVKFVSRRSGVSPDQVPSKDDYLKIASAILRMENGREIKTEAELKAAVKVIGLTQYI